MIILFGRGGAPPAKRMDFGPIFCHVRTGVGAATPPFCYKSELRGARSPEYVISQSTVCRARVILLD